MIPRCPDANTDMELKTPAYLNTVCYIEGNPLEPDKLKKMLVEKAKAVVILSDKLSLDANQADTHTILQAMVIKNYLSQRNANTHLCMQLLKPESITHYKLSLNEEERKNENDQIVCIESMKLSLLAKSCLCPGLVALVTNLIKSSLDPPKKLQNNKDSKNWRWLYDYWNGKKYEIYKIEIPSSFCEQSFCTIANDVYKEEGLLLFALEICVNGKRSGDILLNPGPYKLPKPHSSNTQYNYFGYLIAESQEEAENIFQDKNKSRTVYTTPQMEAHEMAMIAEELQLINEGEEDVI